MKGSNPRACAGCRHGTWRGQRAAQAVDRASDAVDLGDGNWLYTALSEERILRHCPDVRDCTLLAVRGNDGRLTVDVLLALTEDAAPDRNREAEVRAALGGVAVALLLRVVAVPDSEMVLGPTGKVRKFPHAPAAAGQH